MNKDVYKNYIAKIKAHKRNYEVLISMHSLKMHKIKFLKKKRYIFLLLTVMSIIVGVNVSWVLHKDADAVDKSHYYILQEHKHSDECYSEGELICSLPEHEHSEKCFSDFNADKETEEDWKKSLPDDLSDDVRSNMAKIALSQLGYRESEANFEIVAESGIPNGYTRYGQWYNNPYGEWNIMFTLFCMNYAGISQDVIPYDSGCRSWCVKLENNDLLIEPEDAFVMCGDIVFFDSNSDGEADRCGIITYVDTHENSITLKITEGDKDNIVCETEYSWGDSRIVKYLPVAPYDIIEAEETDISDCTEESTETTEEEMPLFSGNSDSGIKASVFANEGAFPENTIMGVYDVDGSHALKVALKTIGDEQKLVDAIGIDISFYKDNDDEIETAETDNGTDNEPNDESDNEINNEPDDESDNEPDDESDKYKNIYVQPVETVRVEITLPEECELNGNKFLLIHRKVNAVTEIIETAEITSRTVSFETDSFSEYIIVGLEGSEDDYDGDSIYLNFNENASSEENPYKVHIGDIIDVFAQVPNDNYTKNIIWFNDHNGILNFAEGHSYCEYLESDEFIFAHICIEASAIGDEIIHLKYDEEQDYSVFYIRVVDIDEPVENLETIAETGEPEANPIHVVTPFGAVTGDVAVKMFNGTKIKIGTDGNKDIYDYVENSAANPYIVKLGEEIEFFVDYMPDEKSGFIYVIGNTEDSKKLTYVPDPNSERNPIKDTDKKRLSKKYVATNIGECSINFGIKYGGEQSPTTPLRKPIYLKIVSPIYVKTAYAEVDKDMQHAYIQELNWLKNDNKIQIISDIGGKDLYIRNTSGIQENSYAYATTPYISRYIASPTFSKLNNGNPSFTLVGYSKNPNPVFNIEVEYSAANIPAENIIYTNQASITGPDANGIYRIEQNFNGSYSHYGTITLDNNSFYYIINEADKSGIENDLLGHVDIEIADGGYYDIESKMDYTDRNNNLINRTITTRYEVFVDSVNSCTIDAPPYEPERDDNGNIIRDENGAVNFIKNESKTRTIFENSDYELHNGHDPSDPQYEYTSVYKSNKRFKVSEIDQNGGITFDINLAMYPRTETITETCNGTSTTKVKNINSEEKYVKYQVILKMNSRQITDAYNKCPNRSGLDFVLAANISDILPLDPTEFQPILKKQFLNGALTENMFTFELYNTSYSFEKDANTIDTPYEVNVNDVVDFYGIIETTYQEDDKMKFRQGEELFEYLEQGMTVINGDKHGYNRYRAKACGTATIHFNRNGKDIYIKVNEENSEKVPLQTAGNYADGNIFFNNLLFLSEGVYCYEIKEKIPQGSEKDSSIIYDDKTISLEVTVTKNEKNELVADAKYSTSDGNTTPLFTNRASYILPETGGIGTDIYTVIGLALIITAFILIKIKKFLVKEGNEHEN